MRKIDEKEERGKRGSGDGREGAKKQSQTAARCGRAMCARPASSCAWATAGLSPTVLPLHTDTSPREE